MANSEPKQSSIVVGVDFSDAGDLAIREAIRMATRSNAALHVTHAVTKHDLSATNRVTELEQESDALRDLPRAVWARLHAASAEAREGAVTHVSVHVRLGEPAEVLGQVAADYDADVIVVGTHRRKGFDRLVAGSVAESVLRSARCSVMVVVPKDHSAVAKTERIAAPRAGAHADQHAPHARHVSSETVEWSRPSWISGLRL